MCVPLDSYTQDPDGVLLIYEVEAQKIIKSIIINGGGIETEYQTVLK